MNAEKERKIIAASRPNAPLAPDGPVVGTFTPQALAAALEAEIAYTREEYAGSAWQTITLHMDIPDARMLAKTLAHSTDLVALRFAAELVAQLVTPAAESLPKLTVTMNLDVAVALARALRAQHVVVE
jgi:hypothetical protein